MHEQLLIALDLAVLLAIEDVRGWTPEQRIAYCHEHAQVVAERSDDLMYGSSKKGETARIFAVLARALACLAYAPGGVRFAGRRWVAGQE